MSAQDSPSAGASPEDDDLQANSPNEQPTMKKAKRFWSSRDSTSQAGVSRYFVDIVTRGVVNGEDSEAETVVQDTFMPESEMEGHGDYLTDVESSTTLKMMKRRVMKRINFALTLYCPKKRKKD